jgi:hypothetical protein
MRNSNDFVFASVLPFKIHLVYLRSTGIFQILKSFLLHCVGPIHHGVACPWFVDGGDSLQMWRVAMIVLNKQLQTTVKGWFSSLVG